MYWEFIKQNKYFIPNLGKKKDFFFLNILWKIQQENAPHNC